MAFPSPGSIHQQLKLAKNFFGVLFRNYNGAAAPSFRQARPPIRVYRKEHVGENGSGLVGQLFKDKEEILRKNQLLQKNTNMYVTEDFSRKVRRHREELIRFAR